MRHQCGVQAAEQVKKKGGDDGDERGQGKEKQELFCFGKGGGQKEKGTSSLKSKEQKPEAEAGKKTPARGCVRMHVRMHPLFLSE